MAHIIPIRAGEPSLCLIGDKTPLRVAPYGEPHVVFLFGYTKLSLFCRKCKKRKTLARVNASNLKKDRCEQERVELGWSEACHGRQ